MTDGAWWHVERVLVRQELESAHVGACEMVSGSSWLGLLGIINSVNLWLDVCSLIKKAEEIRVL